MEEWDVSETQKSAKACVHGMVTQLSPVKVSKCNSSVQYFDGKISNANKNIRMVSFDLGVRVTLESACAKGSSVVLVSCQVKAASGSSGCVGGKGKIMAMSRSKKEASLYKFVASSVAVDEVPTGYSSSAT